MYTLTDSEIHSYIRRGCTPRRLEAVYKSHSLASLGAELQIYRAELVQLAQRWGISTKGKKSLDSDE